MQSLAQPGAAMYAAPAAAVPAAQMQPPAALTPASPDLAPVPPPERVAASEYDSFLAHLTFNSKEIITNLTKIAGENATSVNGIAFVVERRILNAPPSSKLSYLYLLDSIVKNISGVFVARFAQNLYIVFMTVFAVSSPETRASLHRLLNTWPPIFGHELVNAMRHEANPQRHIHVPAPPPMHRPVINTSVRGRAPRIPLSKPPPKTSNHPGRSRSIVQVPIPKRQSAVQVTTNSMSMPIAATSMPQVAPNSMGIPAPGMNGMYGGMHSSQGMRQMVQPGLHGGQTIPPQGMQGYGMHNTPQVYGMPQQMVPQTHMNSASNYGGDMTPKTPAPTERMLETQRMMAELSKKTSSGIGLSNEEYARINSFIDVQLHSVPSPSERDLLITLQQQLRASSAASSVVSQRQAAPPHVQSSAMRSQPHHASYLAPVPPQTAVAPNLNSDALSNLMRSLPELARSAQAVQHQHAQPAPSMHTGHLMVQTQTPMPYSAIRTTSHTSFVRNIYADLPHLSKSDGMRFAKKEELRAHLDWLFARNRRKRARNQNLTSAGVSRCWFDTLAVFLGEEAVVPGGSQPSGVGGGKEGGGEAEKADPLDACVEARGDSEICPACCEAFESFWDDEKQAWMLKEAMRNKHGRAYHTRCAASIPNLDEHEVFDGPGAGEEDTGKDTAPDKLQIPGKAQTPVKEEVCAPNSASKLPAIPRSTPPAVDAKNSTDGGDEGAGQPTGLATGGKVETSGGEMKMENRITGSAPVAGVKKENELSASAVGAEAQNAMIVDQMTASRKRSSVALENPELNESTVTGDERASKRVKAEDSGANDGSRKRSSAAFEIPPSAESEVTGDERALKRLRAPDAGEETSGHAGKGEGGEAGNAARSE